MKRKFSEIRNKADKYHLLNFSKELQVENEREKNSEKKKDKEEREENEMNGWDYDSD